MNTNNRRRPRQEMLAVDIAWPDEPTTPPPERPGRGAGRAAVFGALAGIVAGTVLALGHDGQAALDGVQAAGVEITGVPSPYKGDRYTASLWRMFSAASAWMAAERAYDQATSEYERVSREVRAKPAEGSYDQARAVAATAWKVRWAPGQVTSARQAYDEAQALARKVWGSALADEQGVTPRVSAPARATSGVTVRT